MTEPGLEGREHSLEEMAGFSQWFAAGTGGIIHGFQEVEGGGFSFVGSMQARRCALP